MKWAPRYAPCHVLRVPPKAMSVVALLNPTTVADVRGSVTRVASAVAAGAVVVALYIWDDALLAGPVVAATGFLGPAAAFLIFATLYTLVSFALALLGVRAYDRWTSGRPSRLAQWLDRQRGERRAGWAQRLLTSSRVFGFIVSSFVLGGIVTTFLVRYGGRRSHLERVAFLSSLVFGITFVGAYTGIAHAVFSI
jgi:hypothetical protein